MFILFWQTKRKKNKISCLASHRLFFFFFLHCLILFYFFVFHLGQIRFLSPSQCLLLLTTLVVVDLFIVQFASDLNRLVSRVKH